MSDELKLSKQGMGMILGLGIQYLLGIAIVMYVAFPESGTAKIMWQFAKTQPLIIAHVLIGTLLFLGSIAFAIRAYKVKNTIWIWCTLIGLITILGAWLSGEEFISTQNDSYSLLMSVFFILALLSYVWGIYRSKPINT